MTCWEQPSSHEKWPLWRQKDVSWNTEVIACPRLSLESLQGPFDAHLEGPEVSSGQPVMTRNVMVEAYAQNMAPVTSEERFLELAVVTCPRMSHEGLSEDFLIYTVEHPKHQPSNQRGVTHLDRLTFLRHRIYFSFTDIITSLINFESLKTSCSPLSCDVECSSEKQF